MQHTKDNNAAFARLHIQDHLTVHSLGFSDKVSPDEEIASSCGLKVNRFCLATYEEDRHLMKAIRERPGTLSAFALDNFEKFNSSP